MLADPRALAPDPPVTLEEVERRFLPGFEPVGEVHSFALREPEVDRTVIAQIPGACYAVAAFSAQIRDLDLDVRVGGETVALDVLYDSYPVVQWCASSDDEAAVEVTAFRGDGAGTWRLLAESNVWRQVRGEGDELSNRAGSLQAAAAPRWARVEEVFRSEFTVPGAQELDLSLPGGICHAFLAVGDSGVSDVDLLLLDANGAELTRDLALDATPLIVRCAEREERVRLRVAVVTGAGSVLVERLVHLP